MQEFDPGAHDAPAGNDDQLNLAEGDYDGPGDTMSDGGGLDIGIEDGQAVDLDGDGVADGVAEVTYTDLDGDGQADQATVTVNADTDGDGEADAVVIIDQFDTDGDGLADQVDVTYGVDSDGDGGVDESQYASGTITNTPTDTDGDGEADTVTQDVEWDHESAATGAADPEVYSDESDEGDAESGSGDDWQGAPAGGSQESSSLSSDAIPTGDESDAAAGTFPGSSSGGFPSDASSDGSPSGGSADAGSGDSVTTEIDGETVQLDAQYDLDGDGTNDTAVVQTSDGNYVVVADIDDDGQADQAVLTDADGNIIESAYVDPATGQWVEGTPA